MKNFLAVLLFLGVVNFGFSKSNDTLTTKSGLKYIVLKREAGKRPWKGQKVSIYFTLQNMKGKKLDSNIGGELYKFKLGLGEVIAGLDEGIALMNKGEVFRFIIPAKLAYGKIGLKNPEGNPKFFIEPNADLIYEVELFDFK